VDEVAGPGRPRLERSRNYGADFINWVRTWVLSKGHMRLKDKDRVSDTCESFGALLQKIAAAAKKEGWLVSRGAIYNLFCAPRKNSIQSACRGVVAARPAGPEPKEKAWHARMAFSTMKVRYTEAFSDLCSLAGLAKTRRYHGDGMASTVLWAIPPFYGWLNAVILIWL
jgi:hypothetical protein